ncbi:unnamed protein product, partial [Aureobasidium pullulans]
MVNVLGCIDEASLLNEDSNATCHFQINTLLEMLSLDASSVSRLSCILTAMELERVTKRESINVPINIARHVVQSLFLSSRKVKSPFLAHNVTLLSFSRPGFSSGD